MKRTTLILFSLLACFIQAQTRWKIKPDKSIVWTVKNDIPHYDHIEMSGEQISSVLRYGVNADGSFAMERLVVWPLLRTLPNNTHASLMQRFAVDYPSLLIVNGMTLRNEKVEFIQLDGKLTVKSRFMIGGFGSGLVNFIPMVEITRVFFPSTDKPMLCEQYIVKNISKQKISVVIPDQRCVYKTDESKGLDGSYTLVAAIEEVNHGFYELEAGSQLTFGAFVQGYRSAEKELKTDILKEKQSREDFLNEIAEKLDFECPDSVLNVAFAFAKIRASESIFKTKGGYMHGPGGESYYAAIWANDQAEYVNPFFPFLGYKTGNLSALNSFMHFARFINPEYKPIPSSIIAEGTDIWNGAGDRGDGAMIAYGATRYALARGSKEEARQLWPLIKWCLEFCKRKINEDGVVASDSDELEGRFPAGKANLSTSCLYYDALVSASYLAKELGEPRQVAKEYSREAQQIKKAINSHFGYVVDGFETYRYYEGNDVLRSWICIPLTVGIYDRTDGTIEALFSPRLWTKDGLLTQANTSTFWDRSTLYALRGVYAAGAREKATEYLKHYSVQRLLGEHVPYPIEAWPEGNQRHLSAESGLYCRIITEGLFGIRPIGFDVFQLTPQLPQTWDKMKMKNIQAFAGAAFDINVIRVNGKIKTEIVKDGKVIKNYLTRLGETIIVKL